MPLFGPGAAPDVNYLFVDGACLQEMIQSTLSRYFGGQQVYLDYASLRGGHRKVFFYDAVPVRTDGETADAYEVRTAAKLAYLESVAREDGYHVRSGDARRRRRVGMEQKMVDVQLTVDMMSFASQGVFSKATLLTGDLDFKPLVDALVAMGIELTLFFPPGQTNADLITAADRAIGMDVSWQHGWLAESFRKANPLPIASHVSPCNDLIGTVLHQWKDDRYGSCYVSSVEDGFTLVTGTTNGTHCLRVDFATPEIARLYLLDKFGLVIPQFWEG